MESQVWEDLQSLQRDFIGNDATKYLIERTHVYEDRWILFYMEHNKSEAWNFWIYDTHTKQGVESKLFSCAYPNFVWIQNTFLCCDCYNPDERYNWRTKVYDISHFLPNWY